MCDPEVATANSSWELTVGSSAKEKPRVTRALTMATRWLLAAALKCPPYRLHAGVFPSESAVPEKVTGMFVWAGYNSKETDRLMASHRAHRRK